MHARVQIHTRYTNNTGDVHITLRHVCVTTVAVEKQYILTTLSDCLYSCLSYLTRNAHAPYYIAICGPSGSTIFFYINS